MMFNFVIYFLFQYNIILLLFLCVICLIFYLPNSLIEIFTHLKLRLADAIHSLKWVRIIQIWQNANLKSC